MTLVSMVLGSGVPVLVTDRAISAPDEKTKIILPSTNYPIHEETNVVELNVKSIIIQDVLCVGLVGNVSRLTEIQDDIQDYFMHRTPTRETIDEITNQLDFRDCKVLLALAEKPTDVNSVYLNLLGEWSRTQSDENLLIITAGSGTEFWNNQLGYFHRNLEIDENPIVYSTQRVLMTCMAFLSFERRSTHNLKNGWGGGFDIIYFDNEKFRHLNEATYVFYRVDTDAIDKIEPLSLIHNSYQNGNVIVRNLSVDVSNSYFIRHFKDKFSQPDISSFCSSRIVVCCVHIFHKGEYIEDLGVVYYNTARDPVLYTKFKGNQYGVQFSPVYYEKIKGAVKLFWDSQ